MQTAWRCSDKVLETAVHARGAQSGQLQAFMRGSVSLQSSLHSLMR